LDDVHGHIIGGKFSIDSDVGQLGTSPKALENVGCQGAGSSPYADFELHTVLEPFGAQVRGRGLFVEKIESFRKIPNFLEGFM